MKVNREGKKEKHKLVHTTDITKRVYDTIIVGAGPAGMTAAIHASGEGKRVLLLDRLEKVGKKLLVTGNGKCNITNLDQKPEYYRSDAPGMAWSIFSACDEQEVLKLMERIGVYTKDRDGYVYPYNEQAASVREAFELYLHSLKGLTICTNQIVEDIIYFRQADKARFCVKAKGKDDGRSYCSRNVIIATGGLAGVKLGCEGDGYRFARKLGHSIIAPEPALTALCSSAPFLKKLSGVRCRARLSLRLNDRNVHSETGELQWTDYGISGVAVFCLSRFAIRAIKNGDRVSMSIDFMPEQTHGELLQMLQRFQNRCIFKDSLTLLNGLVASRLSPVLLKEAQIHPKQAVADWTDTDLQRLARVLKDFDLRIKGCKSYEKAQVTMGGIPLNEMTEHMESKYCPGLFFAGEVADVDGSCGGYNLQWAFASGKLAGTRCKNS